MQFDSFHLTNGVSILSQFEPTSQIVHCALVINAGSRDEQEGEMGIAHFIEHMLFKGTAKRRNFHVLNYLEAVGGEINAYTTKEKTCIYCSVRPEYLGRAMELLSDITFFSTFPEKEIAKEKGVIAEEIEMYKESPEEMIFEDFDSLQFPSHTLGSPILGTVESINTFHSPELNRFINREYKANQIALAVSGNVKSRRIRYWADKYFAPLELGIHTKTRKAPPETIATDRSVPNSLHQTHRIIGSRAYPLRTKKYVPLYVLNNYLGGPAMTALLNMKVRENRGLSYNIYSFYNAFSDAGSWGVYFSGEEKNIDKITSICLKEIQKLTERPLSGFKLHQIKKQVLGQLALAGENRMARIIGAAKDLLDFQRIFGFNDIYDEVEKLRPEMLQGVAKEIFAPDKLSFLTFTPKK